LAGLPDRVDEGDPTAWQESEAGEETKVLLVVGLGGDSAYRELFHGWATHLIAGLTSRGVPEEDIVYLGERPEEAPGVVQSRSTKENLGLALSRMAEEAGPDDRVLVVLMGHGSSQGGEAHFNLPGPDLTPRELAVMLDSFTSQSVAIVNTTPSSSPFLERLSGPNRLVLTATRSAQERNETQFGAFFAEAVAEEGADLDKNGRISLLEAFEYARQGVERYYEGLNLLATEHALLDDNGDGEGSTELGEESLDGQMAQIFWLGAASALEGFATGISAEVTDPELRRLYAERADLERRVAELRALKSQMEETQYERELEDLLVSLALKNREIREKGGGG
jgi:hypothetical protein